MEKDTPYRIGRFKIERVLGKGGQGSVFLAFDTTLERKVAVKALQGQSTRKKARLSPMLKEARAVSKLQHPNIIPLYEVGESKGIPYLVFEYVEGFALEEVIKRKGSLSVSGAVTLMSQILDGVSYAHQQGIIHRDLRPANILISRKGLPRVMDFGISQMIGSEDGTESDIKGTLQYMSPEHFSKEDISLASDVFALGLILYEMLTHTPCFEAQNKFALIYKIAYEPTVVPSLMNPKVDKALDSIVLKAVQKEPKARYPNAGSMKEAIDTYLDVKQKGLQAISGMGDTQGTVNFLLRRMKYKSDFPAFSECVIEVNEKTSTDSNASARELAKVILKDYSLTSKLLKLANSSFYGVGDKGITSISQAVVILGFEQVRLTASSMMLFTQMRGKSATEELTDSMIRSFMSGIIAMELAVQAKMQKTEVGFICAMFHSLGRNLTIYYFPEEYAEIKALMERNGLDMHSAAHAVLGISLDELGVSVARYWKFPENIIYSMRSLPEGLVDKPNSTLDTLRHFSVFANELCELPSNRFPEHKGYLLSRLVKRFEPSFSISEKEILLLLHSAINKIQRYASILNIDPEQSHFIQSLLRFADYSDGSESSHTYEDPSHHTPDSAEPEDNQAKNGDSGANSSYGIDEIKGMPTQESSALITRIWQGLVKVAHKMDWR